jgi:hypothetical protein
MRAEFQGSALELERLRVPAKGHDLGVAGRPARMTDQVQKDLFGLRAFLVFVAVLEGFDAILDLPLLIDRPNLLYGAWAVTPTTLSGALLAKLHVAVHPLLAIAALTLCVTGNVRGSLVALAAISVETWLSLLPVLLHDGLPLHGWWDLQWTVAQAFVFPLLAGIVIALAVLTSRCRLAAALIAIPTAYNALGAVMFVVNVILANM